MTPAQQKKALALLKQQVRQNDEAAGGEDNYPDNHAIRMFLIEVGAIPDRRKKKGGEA